MVFSGPRRTPRSFPLLSAQVDPGAAQDAEAERKRLLRAADETAALQAAADSQTAQLTSLKQQVDDLRAALQAAQGDLASLKGDNASLRETVQKMEAARAEERKVLLAEVGKIVADSSSKKDADAPAPAPKPAKKKAAKAATPAADAPASAPDKPEEGYDYVVSKGDTLHAIAAAYQDHGVKVTVADIRATNHLSRTESIHVGQKLFIPKK